MGKTHSTILLDDPDEDEYEYMNKQRYVTPTVSRQNSHLKDTGPWLKTNRKRTTSVSSQVTASSGDVTPLVEVRGVDPQQEMNEVQYEYMDIRGGENEEAPPAHDPPPLPPPLPPSTRPAQELDDEDEYVEDINYHYTNRQPKLRQALQDQKELKIQGRDKDEAYEYEDMDSFAAVRPGDAVVYQNLQRGESAYQSGFEPYVKVRAGVGVGEPAAGDRSFDNPDYWHSRIYLKPKAVPT